MCGICGIYNLDNQKIQKSELTLMNNEMESRGPDSEGFFINNNFGMAMRRLSIIDIEHSNQPMLSDNKNISIIFNGEIYNYIELKNELKKNNVNFRTNGDTEVIIKLYENFGENFVKKLNGMFSICIYDKIENKVLIYRDRFGIKPLYYHITDKKLLFSSSLYSLKKIQKNLKKSKESFFLYLCFNYFPSKKTVYKNVNSLLPGEYIKVENNTISINKYYDKSISKNNLNYEKFDEKIFRDLLNDSIKINLRSDVQLGLFMSSGMDSSIIASESAKHIKNIRAYTVDFEDKDENEGNNAKKFADELDINHEILSLKKKEVPGLLNSILKNMDEPCADTAIIPTYLITKKAKEDGVKVLLSGAGGDEIFGGYSRHYLNFFSFFYGILNFLNLKNHKLLKIFPSKIQNILIKMISKKFAYISNSSGQNISMIIDILNLDKDKNFIIDYLEMFLEGIIKNNLMFNSQEIISSDLNLYLPDNILRPLDKVSMINSVEGRVPFLDHRILEIINYYKIDITKNGNSKFNKKILRNLYKNQIPNYILNNRKKGFNAPLNNWKLDFDLYENKNFNDFLDNKKILEKSKNLNFRSLMYNLNVYNIWSNYN